MKACPITFSHPSEAQQLHGLGPKLCERLTAKLLAHCRDNGLPMPQLQAPTQPEEQPGIRHDGLF
jgi:crossover junction endonuclease MUS81